MSPSGSDGELPAYASAITRITPDLVDRLSASHRARCPVGLDDLRYLRMSYVDLDGRFHVGEMVVQADHAPGRRRGLREALRRALPDRADVAGRRVRR